MIELRLLGTPSLSRQDTTDAGPIHLQPKSFALLAYLAAGSPRVFRRDRLVAIFWPELNDARARNALSQSLHRIRRALDTDVIVTYGAEEVGVDLKRLDVDSVDFAELLAQDRLDEALSLYQGPLLDGFHLSESPEFEHWLGSEREAFRRQASEAASRLADQFDASGDFQQSVNWLRRRLELSPNDEASLRRLMTLLERTGNRLEALSAYDAFTQRLERDFDLNPSPETRALDARLRGASGDWSLATKGTPSVAVLPFSNMSSDAEQEFFCDGITEDLIHALAGISGISVVARTSVFALKGKSFDVRDIAGRLGVDAVVEGSVRRSGERMRITVQLIKASDGYHMWSERYDRPIEDVFVIQNEIAQSIAALLNRELARPESRYRSRTAQLGAHSLYLKGVFHRRKRTPVDLQTAARYFEGATQMDPDYAECYAALAYTYALGGWFTYDAFRPREAYPKAREAAERALALDGGLVEAHVALGYTAWAFEWNWEAGVRALERALEIDPNNYNALAQYSSYLVVTGRVGEGLQLVARVEALEPYWIAPKVYKGVWMLFDGHYQRAVDALLQAQALDERMPLTPLFLGDAYRLLHRSDDADRAYELSLSLMGRQPLILGRIGVLRAEQGMTSAARRILEELQTLSTERFVLPSIEALIHLELGDRDEGLAGVARAVRERDTTLTQFRGYPGYAKYGDDPAIRDLLGDVLG